MSINLRDSEWFKTCLATLKGETRLSFKEIAKQLPVNYAYLSKVMNRRNPVTSELAHKIRLFTKKHRVDLPDRPSVAELAESIVAESPAQYFSSPDSTATTLNIVVTIAKGQVVSMKANILQ